MPPTPLSADTSGEIEALQIERWRQMSGAEKAAIVSGLTQAVFELARAGIRHRFHRHLKAKCISDLRWSRSARRSRARRIPEIAALD